MTTAFRDKESIYCVERRLRGTFAQFKLAAISCGGSIQCPACQCENDTHSLTLNHLKRRITAATYFTLYFLKCTSSSDI